MPIQWTLQRTSEPSLPKLAWVAAADTTTRCVHVMHGEAVEYASNWVVEGIWEAPFEAGEFQTVENFFGSGIRLTEDSVVFAGATALTERLVHVKWQNRQWVSNSLIQLLAVTGARLDCAHDYIKESFASRAGIHRYRNSIRVTHPDFREVFQEYHCNLVLSESGLVREGRSQPRPFESFEDYYGSLSRALQRLRDNAISSHRRQPFALYATASAGYDSTAVAALAKGLGVNACFTTLPEPGLDDRQAESGDVIIKALEMSVIPLWRKNSVSELERYFLAACIDGSEVFYDSLADYVRRTATPAVVFTGYYGDVVWDIGTGVPPFDDDIRRKDVSGLNLCEARLVAGFVNLAVPQIYARNLASIRVISQSQAMRAWSVGTDYDRPIPRRIAESVGVPRDAFGQKKHAQVIYYDCPQNAALALEYADWCDARGFSRWTYRARVALVRRARYWLEKWSGLFLKPSRYAPNPRARLFVWAANSAADANAPIVRPFFGIGTP